jgi:hypothetical protein
MVAAKRLRRRATAAANERAAGAGEGTVRFIGTSVRDASAPRLVAVARGDRYAGGLSAPAGRPSIEENRVAESKKRKKAAYVPPRSARRDSKNPSWLVPTMLTLLIGGVSWILVYYVSANRYPFEIGYVNVLIGFGLMGIGFFLMTRWK